MAQMSFNAHEVDPGQTFEAIPAGWYKAIIEQSEMRHTNAGDGRYLSLRFEIVDGDHKGRRIFTNLNINNPNQKTVEIAQRQLSQLCRAIGVMLLEDTVQLHDKPMLIKVSFVPAKGQYEAGNDVKGYKPLETMAAPEPGPGDIPPSDDDIPDWAKGQ